MADDCDHCEHYRTVTGQLFDVAIQLDDAEDRLHTVQSRLREVSDALVWCLARLEGPPGWIRRALEDAEADAR